MLAERIRAIPWQELGGWLRGHRLRILMYHSIADNPIDPFAIPPNQFGDQMAALAKKHSQVISLDEGLRLLNTGGHLRRCVVITFDDAYRDFLTTALPVLEGFGFPSTVFVPTGLVGRTATWDNHDKSKPLLTWDELRECERRGVAIASHTVSHPRLTDCDDHQLQNELRGSLVSLRENLNRVLAALSYPFGYHGAREQTAAREAGYACAVGTGSRWGNGSQTDLYGLRRETPVP